MKTTDEQLIKSFLKEKQTPLVDNGFTQRVLMNLPQRKSSKIPLVLISTFITLVWGSFIYFTSTGSELLYSYFGVIGDIIEPLLSLDYKIFSISIFLFLLVYCINLLCETN